MDRVELISKAHTQYGKNPDRWGRQSAIARPADPGAVRAPMLKRTLTDPGDTHARRLATRAAVRHSTARPPAPAGAARSDHRGRLSGRHGSHRSGPRRADADSGAALGRGGRAVADARSAAPAYHGTGAGVVPWRAAAHVGYRARRHRGRHRLVGWPAVQRPPGLEPV